MPITKSVTRSSVLVNLSFDMVSGVGMAVMRHTVDGEAAREQTYAVEGAAFAALLTTPGTASLTLADQVTNAVYAYLISSGLVEGVIS
jgi:hypothetical protein